MKTIITSIILILIASCTKQEIKQTESTPLDKITIYTTATANGQMWLNDSLIYSGNNLVAYRYLKNNDTLNVKGCGTKPMVKIYKNDILSNTLSGATGCIGTKFINTK